MILWLTHVSLPFGCVLPSADKERKRKSISRDLFDAAVVCVCGRVARSGWEIDGQTAGNQTFTRKNERGGEF